MDDSVVQKNGGITEIEPIDCDESTENCQILPGPGPEEIDNASVPGENLKGVFASLLFEWTYLI